MPIEDVRTPAAQTGGTVTPGATPATGGATVTPALPNAAGNAALTPTAVDEGSGIIAQHVHIAGGASSALPANAAQESGGNLAAILTKLTSDPATQTTLAAILAKQPAAPALEGGNLATAVARLTSILAALPAALGPATSATSLSVTYPSDKALGVTIADIAGATIQATAIAAVATGAGGQILAGAANRRIYAISATNTGNAITTNIYFTIGAPAGSFPNYTNLFFVLQVASQGPGNFVVPGGYGYPLGNTSFQAVASSSSAAQADPSVQPRVIVYFGP